MNDAKSVRDRLEAALARIEASAARLRQSDRADTEPAGELAALRSERDALGRDVAALAEENRRLARALAEAEADRAQLLTKAERISGQLDGAIHRLESVLEH